MLRNPAVDVMLHLKPLSVYMHDIDRPIASDHFVNRNKPFVKITEVKRKNEIQSKGNPVSFIPLDAKYEIFPDLLLE